jgi:hypothetical protein
MKINEVLDNLTIQVSNEESTVLEKLDRTMPLSLFTEREKFVIENLVKKSLVSKVVSNTQTVVVRNDIKES